MGRPFRYVNENLCVSYAPKAVGYNGIRGAVAELADAADSKSAGVHSPSRFDPEQRHHYRATSGHAPWQVRQSRSGWQRAIYKLRGLRFLRQFDPHLQHHNEAEPIFPDSGRTISAGWRTCYLFGVLATVWAVAAL
jgi:hypothetical protein